MTDFGSPEFLLFSATLLLVIVTAYYAIQTSKTVNEMKKATEAEFLPSLRLALGWIGPVNTQLVVTNAGKGAAIGIKAKFGVRELKDSGRSWTWPMLMPGERETMEIAVGPEKYETSMDFFKGTQSTLDFQAEYSDILGKPHSISHSLDITAQLKQFERTQVGYDEDEVARIREQLEKIARWLESRR